jgi:epoxide hydrolase
MCIRPFTTQIPEATLSDLKLRLAQTRWPDAINDSGWIRGASAEYVKEIVDYREKQFDWRAQESTIN